MTLKGLRGVRTARRRPVCCFPAVATLKSHEGSGFKQTNKRTARMHVRTHGTEHANRRKTNVTNMAALSWRPFFAKGRRMLVALALLAVVERRGVQRGVREAQMLQPEQVSEVAGRGIHSGSPQPDPQVLSGSGSALLSALPRLPSEFVATLTYGGALLGGTIDGPVSRYAGVIAMSEPHAFYQWSTTQNAMPTWSLDGVHENDGQAVITTYTRLHGGRRCDWWTSENVTGTAHECVCTHESAPIFPWPSLPGAQLSRRSVACPDFDVTMANTSQSGLHVVKSMVPNTARTGVCDRWKVPLRPDYFWW